MNTVIPILGDHIASHFTKAESFLFITPEGQHYNTLVNPAFGDSACSTKKKLLELFKAEKVKRVIVRNIGQRSLGRLLSNEIEVFKSAINYIDSEILLDSSNVKLTPLTQISQGRPSLKHEEKNSECGCNDGHTDKKERCGEKHRHNHAGKGKKCCGH